MHRIGICAGILTVSLLAGCSFPKIIILHDPLSADEHAQLGRIYESQGKEDLALQQYRAALKKDPKHAQSWLLLGDLSYQRRDYDEAERAYRRAVKLRPENGDIYNNLAWTYLQQGRNLDKAEELIKQALKLTPGHRPYYLDTLGVILLRLGRVQESLAALKESVDTLPPDRPALLAEAYTHLAEAYCAAGDEPGARAAGETARNMLY